MRISYWPNVKSVARIFFKIFGIVCHKFLPVTWPRPRPFWGKLLARTLGFSKWKLCTKFKVSSSSSFDDRLDCMPKILGVTWPRPPPFWGKLFERPLGFSKGKLCTKLEVSSSSSFEDRFDCMPKILGVTWPRPRPFWENYLRARSAFPRWSCLPNLKSLAQVVLKICSIVFRKFYGSRDLGHAPFGGKIIWAPARLFREEAVYKI